MESCHSFACQPDLWLSNWVFSARVSFGGHCQRVELKLKKNKNFFATTWRRLISYSRESEPRDPVGLNLVCNSQNRCHMLQMAPDPRLTQKYVVQYYCRWDLGREREKAKICDKKQKITRERSGNWEGEIEKWWIKKECSEDREWKIMEGGHREEQIVWGEPGTGAHNTYLCSCWNGSISLLCL